MEQYRKSPATPLKPRTTGGEGGIRTHETVARLHAFQACAFNHSATSPSQAAQYRHQASARNRRVCGACALAGTAAPQGSGEGGRTKIPQPQSVVHQPTSEGCRCTRETLI